MSIDESQCGEFVFGNERERVVYTALACHSCLVERVRTLCYVFQRVECLPAAVPEYVPERILQLFGPIFY